VTGGGGGGGGGKVSITSCYNVKSICQLPAVHDAPLKFGTVFESSYSTTKEVNFEK